MRKMQDFVMMTVDEEDTKLFFMMTVDEEDPRHCTITVDEENDKLCHDGCRQMRKMRTFFMMTLGEEDAKLCHDDCR